MNRAWIVLFGIVACGERPGPRPAVDDGELSRCFASAYADADVDGAIARCESGHFGTDWRKEAVASDGPDGHLDPRLVQAAIEARQPRLRACYRKGVQRNANLRGETRVRLVVAANGHATGVTDAGSRMPDREVLKCVLAEYSSLRFPRPEGGAVTVVHPMTFSPGDTDR